MKLHEIPVGSKIRLPLVRGGAPEIVHEFCTFHGIDGTYPGIDGMFPHITTPDGLRVRLSADAEVELCDGYYVNSIS